MISSSLGSGAEMFGSDGPTINRQDLSSWSQKPKKQADKSPISQSKLTGVGNVDKSRKSVTWNKLQDSNLVDSRKQLFGRRQTLFNPKMNKEDKEILERSGSGDQT